MAEALSITFALLTAINIAQNAFKLVETLQEFDEPKVDQIYYRLIAEKAKLEGWTNSRRNEYGPDLQTNISSENWSQVETLIAKMNVYFERAEVKYGKIGAAEKGRRIAAMKARLFFIRGGYESLVDLLDTLKSMNEALLALAPILPGFSPSPNTDTESVPLRPARLATTDDPELPSINTVFPPAEPKPQPMVAHNYLPSLLTIFNLAVGALHKISRQCDDEVLRSASARLKLWGAGLFQDPVTLDQIFEPSDAETDALRKGMLKVFTSILVVEERNLKRLCQETEYGEREDLSQTWHQIAALLGTDELIKFAIEMWTDYIAEQQMVPEEHRGPDFEQVPKDIKTMSRTIECLFDLLPAIRARRRVFCHLAQQHRKQVAIPESSAVSISEERAVLSDQLYAVHKEIKEIDQKTAATIEKVTERLDEFYNLHRKKALTDETGKRVAETQARLAQQLDTWLKNQSLQPELARTKTSIPSSSLPEKKRGPQVKPSLTAVEEKELYMIIESAQNLGNDLWSSVVDAG